jgi:7-dehydrocholesterol reductase
MTTIESPKTGALAAAKRHLLPLLLLVPCPPFAMLLWHTHVHLGGSLQLLLAEMAARGPFSVIRDAWWPVFFGSRTAWAMLGAYAAFELALMRLLPGREFRGPVTPAGNVPVYKANGPLAFAITLAAFYGVTLGSGLLPASIIYDHFGELLGALNLFSLLFCLGLYLKGRFAPSSADTGTSGSFVFDYYWGTELFPRVLGFDVKMFTNCRFGMMGWPLILISFAAAQAQRHGLSDSMIVAVTLQLVYIAKFFWWETGYLASLDIMHDRAGFYICWGVLVWLPSVYTSSTLYLVDHPNHLGRPLALGIFALGVVAILANYAADAQRQRVRATQGACRIFGKAPVLIAAPYTTPKGERVEGILLASGFWGVSRHFHYLPELLAAFLWTAPALFFDALPYFYFAFLTALLVHRSVRDDKRCAAKYGAAWEEYRRRVRFRMVPGVF